MQPLSRSPQPDPLPIEPSDPGEASQRAAAHVSSAAQVVREVVRGLHEGLYATGQRLVESDLMRRYGVGRGTVREAISTLAAQGVVTLQSFRGAHIRRLSRTESIHALEVMELLVGLAARLAAQQIGKPGRRAWFEARIDGLIERAVDSAPYEAVLARNRLYRSMIKVGGNRELERLMPMLHVQLIRAQLQLPREERLADYRAMGDAILSGDAGRAEEAGRAHVRRTAAILAMFRDDEFAPEDDAGSVFDSTDLS